MASLSKNRPWGLGKSVEYFQLRIENIPRLDVVCQIDSRPLGNEEHSLVEAVQPVEGEDGVVWADDEKVLPQKSLAKRYEIQRWVLTQLGRMTRLKEFNLGVPDTVSSPVTKDVIDTRALGDLEHPGYKLVREFKYQSLEFLLESGLELLAGLKELQVLDVRWTAHRSGVEELEWMHLNWPRMKEVNGLYLSRKWTGDEDGSGEWKAAVDEWMAAHPNGIGSSYCR